MRASDLGTRRSDLSVRRQSGQAMLVSAPASAARRSPTPHPAAPRASRGTPSAHQREGLASRDAPGAPRRHPPAPQQATAPRAAGGRRASGTAAPRRACARPETPPRGRPGDAGDTAARDSTAWWGPHAPSGEDDAHGRSGHHSPGSGSRGPDAEAPAVRQGESSGSGPDLDHPALVIMVHQHPARVAGQALGRFRARHLRPARGSADTGSPARRPAPA